jgi:hypothetical protein
VFGYALDPTPADDGPSFPRACKVSRMINLACEESPDYCGRSDGAFSQAATFAYINNDYSPSGSRPAYAGVLSCYATASIRWLDSKTVKMSCGSIRFLGDTVWPNDSKSQRFNAAGYWTNGMKKVTLNENQPSFENPLSFVLTNADFSTYNYRTWIACANP